MRSFPVLSLVMIRSLILLFLSISNHQCSKVGGLSLVDDDDDMDDDMCSSFLCRTLVLLLVNTVRRVHSALVALPILVRGLIRKVQAGDFGDVSRQPFLAVLVLGVALLDLLKTVSHEELVEPRRKDGGRDVHQDGDPRVRI